MKKNLQSKKDFQIPYVYLLLLTGIVFLTAVMVGDIRAFPREMYQILTSPSQLFTDYIEVATLGGALLNVAVMMFVSIATLYLNRVHLNGGSFASIGMLAGFSFFGKNLLNSIPIMLGVWIYAKVTKQKFRPFVMVSLFGTSLGPLVSFLMFGAGIPMPWNMVSGVASGIFVGLCLPVLASQFVGFHQGFSLYNVGFTTGIIGMIVIAVMNAFNVSVETKSALYQGEQSLLYGLLIGWIALLMAVSYYLHVEKGQLYQWKQLHALSGRLPSDYLELTNGATVAMNSAMLGVVLVVYVFLIGGTLNGPIVGGIIGVMSFGAFGNHLKNTIPVLLGIWIGAMLTDVDPTSTSAIVAAIFGTTLAPISGYYGVLAGMIAGFLHITLVGHVAVLHAGVNLYNNGFAGGFVAAFLIPLFETIEQILKNRKRKGQKK